MNILIETFFKKENIILELDALDIHGEEKEKLLKMADELAELRFLNIILEKLEEEDKELFLERSHSGSAEALAEFLHERIENIEEVLIEHAKVLENEILEDIRSLTEGEN